jgi:hypothetical protein
MGSIQRDDTITLTEKPSGSEICRRPLATVRHFGAADKRGASSVVGAGFAEREWRYTYPGESLALNCVAQGEGLYHLGLGSLKTREKGVTPPRSAEASGAKEVSRFPQTNDGTGEKSILRTRLN